MMITVSCPAGSVAVCVCVRLMVQTCGLLELSRQCERVLMLLLCVLLSELQTE